ncbi:MAG: chromate transporter [Ruminococcaceae bacterium]|nr:chromate transporter [Oscillospiraceae bacterium]
MKEKLKRSLVLFVTFFKIGAFTFGGGYAMIPLIQKEVVEKKRWITDSDILDIIAIAESTPGPIAINSATFVGYKIAGVLGSFCATLGVVLPSFVVISLISVVLREFSQIQAVQFAFRGIRAGVLALILKALISMYKQCPKNAYGYVIMALAFVGASLLKLNVLAVLIFCAVFGLVASLVADRRAKK